MRPVTRLWPAWSQALTTTAVWAVVLAWLLPLTPHNAPSLLALAAITCAILGVTSGLVAAGSSRRMFRIDGARLTPTERIRAVNMSRGLDDDDDPRLHQAATRVAERAAWSMRAFGVIAALDAVVIDLAVTHDGGPRIGLLVAALVLTAALGARPWWRRRKAARAYLATDRAGAPVESLTFDRLVALTAADDSTP